MEIRVDPIGVLPLQEMDITYQKCISSNQHELALALELDNPRQFRWSRIMNEKYFL